jgi:hypothetical protein
MSSRLGFKAYAGLFAAGLKYPGSITGDTRIKDEQYLTGNSFSF